MKEKRVNDRVSIHNISIIHLLRSSSCSKLISLSSHFFGCSLLLCFCIVPLPLLSFLLNIHRSIVLSSSLQPPSCVSVCIAHCKYSPFAYFHMNDAICCFTLKSLCAPCSTESAQSKEICERNYNILVPVRT